ncbi:MAG: BamA/TamA family outer membrane protein [Thermoanaerobaculia bacterium]|nr:BamA/TamA family outer membrane protein [Thermoanaerobaculia bacterium]
MRLRSHAIVLALIAVLAFAGSASAQYFGRNKVKWDKFRFQVLQTQHFDIHYYPEQKAAAEDVARMAERWYDRYSKFFDHQFSRKPIVLYADHPDFQQTTTIDSSIGEGLGGFTDAFQNRIVMPLTGTYAETDHVLGHEMVHVFQYDIALSRRGGGGGGRKTNFQLMSLPLWMIEGLAEYLSQGRVDPQTSMWVRDAMISDKLPDREKLTRDPRFSPYQYGQAFWAWIGGRWGDEAVRELFLGAGMLGIDEAFRKILNMPSKDAFAEWQQVSKDQYGPALEGRVLPSALGAPLIPVRKRTFGANVDLAPSLSPDGKWLAFLSARGLFSIDLYLANAETGEIVAELSGPAGEPHYESLRFIDSSGSWAPDSESFAFVVTQGGDNRIAILDVETRTVTDRIELSGIGAITNPAWSPDGRTIAFSGQAGGITDIYLMDVETKKVSRLTDDRFGDLQPAWSPDGKSIAFVSERGEGTDLNALVYGPLRISVIDVVTKQIRTLPIFEIARHINPQWAPDGKSIWLVANPDGIADVFQYELESGQIRRRTNVATGVSGITDLSPALSVASRQGRVVYSLFNDGGWQLFTLDPKTAISTETSFVSMAGAPAAVLPPAEAVEPTKVANYLKDPGLGLLPAGDPGFSGKRYDRSLRLDYVGPPTVGVGVDSRGVGVGGSIALGFSDVLGTHKVGLFLQGGGTTSDLQGLFGGQVYYLNQANRLQWGGSFTHLPYSTRYTLYDQDTVIVDGVPTPAEIYQEVEERTTLDEVALITQYPFGPTRRIEASAGYNYVGYEIGVDQFIFVNGQLVDQDDFTVDDLESIGYARGAVAFVGDSSIFGIASPIAGTRYRVEVATNSGDLDFESGLVDYRKYFFNRPVTLAFRGVYLGRHGDGAEDQRLNPLDISNSTLVRGYSDYDFDECTPIPGRNCPEVARLLGSKMAVLNVEFRVPLLGPREFGLIEAPYFPTEFIAFAEGGAAWTEDESVDWTFERETAARVPVFSAGIALRTVLGGVLPLQFYYAFPFQRPEKDSGEFGFLIVPGW